jgi:N-lysine methyltransferase SETD6
MGSLVLSRSFTLCEEEEDDHENDVENSLDSVMDIDPPHNGTSANNSQEENEEGGGEDEEEIKIVMIPLADILNARYNTENVQPTPGFVIGICTSDWLTLSSAYPRLNSSMNQIV